MKVGTILKIDHNAYGRYAMVVRANKMRVVVDSEGGMELHYDPPDAAQFEVVGRLVVGKQYSPGERKFRRVTLERPGGIDQQIDVRVDEPDGTVETSIPAIRLRAFYQWAE